MDNEWVVVGLWPDHLGCGFVVVPKHTGCRFRLGGDLGRFLRKATIRSGSASPRSVD